MEHHDDSEHDSEGEGEGEGVPAPIPPPEANNLVFNQRVEELRLRRAEEATLAVNLGRKSFATYTTLSALSALLLVFYAYTTRGKQFYPAVVFLSTSKVSAILLGNFGIAFSLGLFRVNTAVFLNGLNEDEMATIGDHLKYALTETCLALTMFREEIGVSIVVMFLLLLLMKALHWSCDLRVMTMRQTEDGAQLWHNNLGLCALLFFLFVSDLAIASSCTDHLLANGPSVEILFGFEAAVAALGALGTMMKFTIYAYDANLGDVVWHNKGNFVFAVEFAVECLRFFFYCVFFSIVFTYYGMPFNICRDLWMSYSSLRAKLEAFTRYRKLTKNMNERFPDATAEELEQDNTCIICRDEMVVGACKKIPCGHIFHFYCLRQWLQQQQNCPTCRQTIPTTDVGFNQLRQFGFASPQPTTTHSAQYPTMIKVTNYFGAQVKSSADMSSTNLRLVKCDVSLVALAEEGGFWRVPDGYISMTMAQNSNVNLERFLVPGFLESTPVRERPDGEVEALRREIGKLKSTVDLLLKKGL